MIRIHLPPAEANRLEKMFRSTDDRKFRDRLQIVRMASQGRLHQAIAADLGVNRKTVTRWLNAYCDGGFDALRPRKAPGKAGHIPAELAETVRQWVIDGPAACGLDRANWTHEELAGHLLATHGVQTSRSAVQRFCSRIGIRLYRPTYRYLRGDPAKQAAAKRELADLGKGRRPATSSC
jgi:transposase